MSGTYDEILHEMEAEYQSLTGMQADSASDIGIRIKLLAGQLYSAYSRLKYVHMQAFPQTAQGEYLDRHAQMRGIERKAALCARGTLRFSRSEPSESEFELPEGIICTAGEDGEEYFTVEAKTLPVGGTEVFVEAKAVNAGKSGNAAIGSVNVMPNPPQGIETVTNVTVMHGGENAEGDEELRRRVLQSFRGNSNGVNKAFYYDFAMSFDGVKKAAVLPRVRGRGTVDIIIAPRGAQDVTELLQKIEDELQAQREIGVDVSVRSVWVQTVNVTVNVSVKPEYSFDDVRARVIAAAENFSERLQIGEAVTLAALGHEIYEAEGVANYSFESPAADVLIDADAVAVLNVQDVIMNR